MRQSTSGEFKLKFQTSADIGVTEALHEAAENYNSQEKEANGRKEMSSPKNTFARVRFSHANRCSLTLAYANLKQILSTT